MGIIDFQNGLLDVFSRLHWTACAEFVIDRVLHRPRLCDDVLAIAP